MSKSPTWSFMDHVTSYMTKGRRGDPRPPTLWPSEASALIQEDGKEKIVGQCRRATFFRWLSDNYKFYDHYTMWAPLIKEVQGNILPTDKYMLWIHRQGELLEELIVEQAKTAGVFVDAQTPVYIPSLKLSGKKDVEVINPETGKYSCIEIKSVYGYGANAVLGTPGSKKGGEPRNSNLMQVGMYHYWSSSADPNYEESRLLYGARDTGRYAEYLVKTEEDTSTNKVHIHYRAVKPHEGSWVKTPITINAIVKEYQNQQIWLDSGIIPGRDYDLMFTEEQLADLYKAGELPETEKLKYEKVMERREENKILLAAGKKPKKELKQIQRGCWQCEFCRYKQVCYKSDGTPKEI